ncbi:MAG: signal peptidase II [Gammaproteobacteria bacterium]|jgi:signal peptidase II
MSDSGSQLKWLWLSLLVIIADQASKQLAEYWLTPHQTVEVIPYFEWFLTYNTGAAFSFLADAGGWQRWFFSIAAIVISLIILQWIRKLPGQETATAVSLSLILGGAIGNVIDRIWFGHVIDFIQVWLGSYAWPAFNVADSAISIGAVLLIISSFSGNANSEN